MSNRDSIRKNHVNVIGNLQAHRSIIFVHGFGTDQRVWNEVAASFLDNFRIIVFDNVGAGQSDPADFVQHRYLQLEAYATDLIAICQTLDLREAILVGHSVGGMISLLAAIRQPEICAKLVLIGASPRYLDDDGYQGGFTKDDLNGLYQAVTLGYSDWADHFAPLAMGNPDQPGLAVDFATSIKCIPADRALTVLCSIFQSDHRADLVRLDKPTLLIQSHKDVAVPLAVADYLHRHIRGSHLAIINATGHLPHVSAPAEVVAAMRDFIDD